MTQSIASFSPFLLPKTANLMKISTALEGFGLEKCRQVSARTPGNYARIFSQLIEHLGDVEFETVTTIDICRHLDYLEREQGLARRSVDDAG